MQVELQDEADKLSFWKEYMLGEEPMRMDMLLIKKNTKDKVEKNTLYQSVMEIIVNANKEKFGEVKKMCNALLELMKDDLDEREQIGEARGKVIGEQQGESRVNRLVIELSNRGRMNDILKAASDREYQKQLFAEFNL